MKTVEIKLKIKLKEFNKKKISKGYILDLRNNPGGLLSQAIKISDFFLKMEK
jgi:Periplasmic protease